MIVIKFSNIVICNFLHNNFVCAMKLVMIVLVMFDVATPVFTTNNGIFIVVGLNSFMDSGEEFDTTAYAGIYVKIGSHLEWIHLIMNFYLT